MSGVSTGIFGDSNFMNLKAISQNEIRNDIFPMLVNDEQIVSAFMTIRDQVIFTTNYSRKRARNNR